MNFNANTKQLEVTLNTLENMSYKLRYVLRCIRELAALPMDKYKKSDLLTRADYAQKTVLDAAALMGIDFGARWGNELDLRDEGELLGLIDHSQESNVKAHSRGQQEPGNQTGCFPASDGASCSDSLFSHKQINM